MITTSESVSFLTTPAVALFCGLLMIAVLAVLFLAACVGCGDEKKDDVEMRNKDRVSKTNHESTDLKEVVVAVTQNGSARQSNGSAQRDSGGDRPTHDNRALPEIPGADGVLATDDSEMETDSNYDVIGRKLPQDGSARKMKNHPYEKVSDPLYSGINEPEADDPLYDGIKETATTVTNSKPSTSAPTGGATKTNPYAVVKNIGDPDYAVIADKKKRMSQNRSQSNETLEGSYASVPPPPVPDKNYTDEPLSVLTTSPNGGTENQQQSPSLPPRNSTSSVSPPIVQNCAETVPPQGFSLVEGPANFEGANNFEEENVNPSGKKEPPYTGVTVRESLNHMKERQKMEERARQDPAYETVDYDLITSPEVPKSTPMFPVSDRNSLSSDLYAEIGSGAPSVRSSTYARVGDVSAPTPPPVERLKNLSLAQEQEDSPDPGYSQIKKVNRESTSQTPQSTASTSGRRSPVYAVVDKTKKKPTDESQPPHSAANNVEFDPASLYSQVNKPASRISANYDNSPRSSTGHRHSNSDGANHNIEQTKPLPSALGDPGYQTIGSVQNYRVSNSYPVEDDPDYDSLDDRLLDPPPLTDNDPNYERVGSFSKGGNSNRVSTSSRGGAAEMGGANREMGVAREITDSNGNEDDAMVLVDQSNVTQGTQGSANARPRRDPIYMEIDESKQRRSMRNEMRVSAKVTSL